MEILEMFMGAVGMVAGREQQPGGPADGGGRSPSGDLQVEGGREEGRGPEGRGVEAPREAAVAEEEEDDKDIEVDEDEDNVSVERLRCLVHGQEGTLYCRTDEKIVCVLCAVLGEHRGHEIITLHEAYTWQKQREGYDLLAETRLMGQRIKSKWTDPSLSKDQLQTFVNDQFDGLKSLVLLEDRRTVHLVDLKEAFLTATAAEQIAELNMETRQLQKSVNSVRQEMRALKRAHMAAEAAALAAPQLMAEGARDGLGQPDGQPGRQVVNSGGIQGRQVVNSGGIQGRQVVNSGGIQGRQVVNSGGIQGHQVVNSGGVQGRQVVNSGGIQGRQVVNSGGIQGRQVVNSGTPGSPGWGGRGVVAAATATTVQNQDLDPRGKVPAAPPTSDLQRAAGGEVSRDCSVSHAVGISVSCAASSEMIRKMQYP
ncbi:hypothetical protein NHX12_002854, partial [Muraenolepis orangiensis]